MKNANGLELVVGAIVTHGSGVAPEQILTLPLKGSYLKVGQPNGEAIDVHMDELVAWPDDRPMPGCFDADFSRAVRGKFQGTFYSDCQGQMTRKEWRKAGRPFVMYVRQGRDCRVELKGGGDEISVTFYDEHGHDHFYWLEVGEGMTRPELALMILGIAALSLDPEHLQEIGFETEEDDTDWYWHGQSFCY